MSTQQVIAELLKKRIAPTVCDANDEDLIKYYEKTGKSSVDRVVCLTETVVEGQPIVCGHACSTTPSNLGDAERFWILEHFARTGMQMGVLRIIMLHGKAIPFQQQDLKMFFYDASTEDIRLVKEGAV
jgi:hypothetical protein